MKHSDLEPGRRYGEDFEAYRKRRRAATDRVRRYLKTGRVVWCSTRLEKNGWGPPMAVKVNGTFRRERRGSTRKK